MKIYLVCPVRYATPEFSQAAGSYVAQLESQGYQVYWPARDTDQVDPTGLRICKDNRHAIEAADEVHVIWDGFSQGSIFDLGIAFALRKQIVPVTGCFPSRTTGKSIQNMVYDWHKNGAN
jgi:nucleoside 2-deoxyribosyltransferase